MPCQLLISVCILQIACRHPIEGKVRHLAVGYKVGCKKDKQINLHNIYEWRLGQANRQKQFIEAAQIIYREEIPLDLQGQPQHKTPIVVPQNSNETYHEAHP